MFQLSLDVYDVEDFDIQGEFYIVDVLWETRAICDKEAVEEVINQIYEEDGISKYERQDAKAWLYGDKKDGDTITVDTVDITYMKKGI